MVDMKQRNPSWGCPRIAQQITLAFGIAVDKDVVRRILAARYNPTPDSAGPSWLAVLGHAKNRLWSVDLFRCESAVLHTYWVLVVIDYWTRRMVGFGVHRGVMDGHRSQSTFALRWTTFGCDRERRLVRKKGFEPSRPCGHKLLRLARLPVPPLPHEG